MKAELKLTDYKKELNKRLSAEQHGGQGGATSGTRCATPRPQTAPFNISSRTPAAQPTTLLFKSNLGRRWVHILGGSQGCSGVADGSQVALCRDPPCINLPMYDGLKILCKVKTKVVCHPTPLFFPFLPWGRLHKIHAIGTVEALPHSTGAVPPCRWQRGAGICLYWKGNYGICGQVLWAGQLGVWYMSGICCRLPYAPMMCGECCFKRVEVK